MIVFDLDVTLWDTYKCYIYGNHENNKGYAWYK